MADTDEETEADGAETADGESIEQTIKKLARSNRRLSWAVILLVLVVAGLAGFEIKMLQDRVGDMEVGVKKRVVRATDDYARIQDQTAALRGGIELLHKEVGHVRTQMNELNRRLSRADN